MRASLPAIFVLGIFVAACGDDSVGDPPVQPPRGPEQPGGGGETSSVAFELTDKIVAPESVTHVGDHLYISQLRGGSSDVSGKGVISRVGLDGKGFVETFASGLNAPHGMRAFDGILWVADLNRLVPVSLTDGSIAADQIVTVEPIENVAAGKITLNDVAVDKAGNLYVSDTLGNRIFKVKLSRRADEPRVVEVLFADKQLDFQQPNGLLVADNALFIASWGTPKDKATFAKDFATSKNGELLRLDLGSGELTTVVGNIGNLDGLESDGKGRFLVTDWIGGTLFHAGKGVASVAPDRPIDLAVLADFDQGAADLAYIVDKNLAVVPITSSNTVVAIHPFKQSE